ncbi:MAG: prephenate dehydrogenase/arogenate dehydrogenase family protein, partial [Comamonadaceae bacterium]
LLRDNVGVFVPCHPVAGKELSGVEHADVDLYVGKQVVVTPVERTQPLQLQRAIQVWEGLQCNVTQMTPESHDAAFAAVSHLPHLIAFALVNGIASQPNGQDFLQLAGPGFRDFTRIAASEPKMWRDVLLANRQELLAQSQVFQRTLQALEAMIEAENADALEGFIAQASNLRAHWRMGPKKH